MLLRFSVLLWSDVFSQEERNLEDFAKTVKPLAGAKGVAGGLKFLKDGSFFKFATGSQILQKFFCLSFVLSKILARFTEETNFLEKPVLRSCSDCSSCTNGFGKRNDDLF